MNISFYCKHCGKYLRRGNHTECKRILREKRAAEQTEAERLALGEKARKSYAKGWVDLSKAYLRD